MLEGGQLWSGKLIGWKDCKKYGMKGKCLERGDENGIAYYFNVDIIYIL